MVIALNWCWGFSPKQYPPAHVGRTVINTDTTSTSSPCLLDDQSLPLSVGPSPPSYLGPETYSVDRYIAVWWTSSPRCRFFTLTQLSPETYSVDHYIAVVVEILDTSQILHPHPAPRHPTQLTRLTKVGLGSSLIPLSFPHTIHGCLMAIFKLFRSCSTFTAFLEILPCRPHFGVHNWRLNPK